MTRSNTRKTSPYEPIGEIVSIFQRGKTWWANWQHDGKQHRKSLKTTSKKEARLRGLRLEADIVEGKNVNRVQAPPISEAVTMYLTYLESERRCSATLKKYRPIFERLQQFGSVQNVVRLDQITVPFLDKYRHARVTAGRTKKTVYCESVIIRQLVNFAKARGLLVNDPLQGLKISEPKPTPQPCFSPVEVEQILEASREPQRSVYTVLADTGARIGEIKWLTWEDVDFERNVLRIRPKDNWSPKTGDQRAIPMSKRVRKMLKSRSRGFRWVFTAAPSKKYPKGGHQISERRLLRSLKRLLKRLNIRGHLHTFRHAFISNALSKGVPESEVRAIVGHVDDKIIRLYTHIADRRLQQAIESISS
ncbi:MAG: tyrosine-type recombinase/integrase [Planctomycetaceae bacterium]|nr:tyrosine-type recombinase/integrase [Planctomycetaceae bacterium]